MANAAPAPVKPLRKVRTGTVVSNRMQKTIVVRFDRLDQHKTYGRVIGRAVSFKVHDERQEARVGDLVRVEETRPLSKEKRWRLIAVLQRASQQVAEVADPLSDEQQGKQAS